MLIHSDESQTTLKYRPLTCQSPTAPKQGFTLCQLSVALKEITVWLKNLEKYIHIHAQVFSGLWLIFSGRDYVKHICHWVDMDISKRISNTSVNRPSGHIYGPIISKWPNVFLLMSAFNHPPTFLFMTVVCNIATTWINTSSLACY